MNHIHIVVLNTVTGFTACFMAPVKEFYVLIGRTKLFAKKILGAVN
jgi:hypothetical protein